MPSKRTPPPELQPYVQQIADALIRLSRGEDSTTALGAAVDRAVRTATDLGREPEHKSGWTMFAASFAAVIGANLKALRMEAGVTQAAVADAMAAAGFDWKRITCAEVEIDKRRVKIEEVLALAVLFAIPTIELLLPDDNTVIEWPQGDLPREDVLELFLGLGGSLGTGAVNWRAAARAAGRPKTRGPARPAVDLWANRVSSERHTQPPQSAVRARTTKNGK